MKTCSLKVSEKCFKNHGEFLEYVGVVIEYLGELLGFLRAFLGDTYSK